jgi:NAD-dependent dihydropyrimidine dehydrogenase PreA subunit
MKLKYLKDVVTLEFDQQKCTGCGMCIEVCPHEVIAIENKKATIIDKDACMECGACGRNCPASAISVRAGVGCASGIIRGKLKGGEPCCGDKDGCCC